MSASITNKLAEEPSPSALLGGPPGAYHDWELIFTGPSPAPGAPPARFVARNPHATPAQWEALATPGQDVTVCLISTYSSARISRRAGAEGAEWFFCEALVEGESGDVSTETVVPTTPELDAQLRAAVAEGLAWHTGAAAE